MWLWRMERISWIERVTHETVLQRMGVNMCLLTVGRQRQMDKMRMCGVTKKDKIRNEHVRGSVEIAPVTKKITEKRLE